MPNDKYLKELTSLRGIAALMVCMFHLRYTLDDFSFHAFRWFKYPVLNKADLWVDFFFVLSGFILAFKYSSELKLNTTSISRYYWARIIRIFPLQILFVFIYLVFNYIRFDSRFFSTHQYKPILANLFLIHGWGNHFGGNLNFPSWSLSVEWGAYLVFPLFLFCFRVIQRRTTWILLWILFFTLPPLFSTLLNLPLEDMKENHGLLRCLPEFIGGIALYHSFHKTLDNDSGSSSSNYIFPISLLLLIVFFQSDLPTHWFGFLASILLLGAVLSGSMIKKILHLGPLQWLGEISFSLFMSHAFIMEILVFFFKNKKTKEALNLSFFQSILFFAIEIFTCLLFARFIHRFFEKPFFKLRTPSR